jgi:Ca2+-binding EF-hand superfamily protein
MTTLPTRLGDKWADFNLKIEASFENSEEKEVSIDTFVGICKNYNINITDQEHDTLFEAFPGKIVGTTRYLDMSHLIELVKASDTDKLYSKVDLSDDDEEEMGDFSGYTGLRQNDNSNIEVVPYVKLIDLFVKEDKLPFILKSIRDIDQDNNGYVTTTELEDILRVHYPMLQGKNVKKIFKPFASIQNRILIDYVSLIYNYTFWF